MVVWLYTPYVVKLFASGFQGDTLQYAIDFTRVSIISLLFSTFLYVYTSYLQANNVFKIIAFAAIPNSICIILSIVFAYYWNINALSFGSVLAVFIQLCFLVKSLHKCGYHFKLNFDWKNKYVRMFFRLLAPVILGISVNQINTLVDRRLASQITVGGISALIYADSLIQFVRGFLSQISTVSYPNVTKLVNENKTQKAEELTSSIILILLLILLPIAAWFVVYSYDVIELLFLRGALDEKGASLTSVALVFYSIGIPFLGIRDIISGYFYAYNDTKNPAKNSLIGLGVNIVFNLMFSKWLGIGGLALATSFAAIITTVLLFVDSKRCENMLTISIDKIECMKIIISTLVMSVALIFIDRNLYECAFVRIICSLFFGGVIYLICNLVLRVKLIENILIVLKEKLSTRRKEIKQDK